MGKAISIRFNAGTKLYEAHDVSLGKGAPLATFPTYQVAMEYFKAHTRSVSDNEKK